jgi:hypothetical protein
MLYQLQKIGYFWILVCGLELHISGTLSYNVILRLFSGRKSRLGMKGETQFSREKAINLICF